MAPGRQGQRRGSWVSGQGSLHAHMPASGGSGQTRLGVDSSIPVLSSLASPRCGLGRRKSARGRLGFEDHKQNSHLCSFYCLNLFVYFFRSSGPKSA